jgi:hypothetical protein
LRLVGMAYLPLGRLKALSKVDRIKGP